MDNLRVLVVADDPIARAGLAALLSEQPELTIVAQVGSDADLTEAFEGAQADVILYDLGWESEAALEHLAEAREMNLPVTALLAGAGEAGPALDAGARGVLLRTAESRQIAAALAGVASGLTVLDPILSAGVLPGREPPTDQPADQLAEPPSDQLVEELTPREREVLQLLADGLPNRAIAERLTISEHTVKFHVNAIMGKLGARTRTEAVTRAARLGLLIL